MQWLDTFKREAGDRLRPLLPATFHMAWREMERRVAGADTQDPVRDERAELYMLRADQVLHEQRWQGALLDGFQGWPRPPVAPDDRFALLSDFELQIHLVGQPVIEALERRFANATDLIDSRLRSLAQALDSPHRPLNPFAPRALVEAMLRTVPVDGCGAAVRQLLLRTFERVAGESLGSFYAWVNAQLAEGGFALQADTGYGVLPLPDRTRVDAREGWVDPIAAMHAQIASDTRVDRLRRWVRARHPVDAADARRELRDAEFLTVLSLLQGDADATPDTARAVATAARERIVRGAASLGLEAASTRLSDAQHDAIALASGLVEALLREQVLDEAATRAFARCTYPLVRALLTDPALLEDPTHPLRMLLADAAWAWDANPRERPEDVAAYDAAMEAIVAVINDFHGNTRVAEQAQARLLADLGGVRTRATVARARIAQTCEGRERLEAARARADAVLRAVVERRVLLDRVCAFLDGPWRHALVQAWLRDGPNSERMRRIETLGDALVALDAMAADGDGARVADLLLRIDAPLRDCLRAGGQGDEAAHDTVAELVGDIARPDAPRNACTPAPLAEGPPRDADSLAHASHDAPALRAEQWIVWRDGAATHRAQVAWVGAHRGDCVLVNRAGQRIALFDGIDVRALLADGRVQVRPDAGPLEAALAAWQRDADAMAD